ncbi:MAG: hypothetical protein Pg6C_15540 [Treponemataceae bacterium]|jgi:pyocin large subunit-like protein|nr:MAG: hypothetical protein Pg6C_15540 [Treponemataceae bacterium]
MGTGEGNQYYRTKGASGQATCGGRIKATDFLPGELAGHFDRHGKEFGDADEKKYLSRARDFFNKPVTNDILWFEDVDGYLYKYDKKRREFGICSPEGAIVTYFKPDRGINYWIDEVMKHGQ